MSHKPTEDKVLELLLEQYKLYVEMADEVSARRFNASRLYISLFDWTPCGNPVHP